MNWLKRNNTTDLRSRNCDCGQIVLQTVTGDRAMKGDKQNYDWEQMGDRQNSDWGQHNTCKEQQQ